MAKSVKTIEELAAICNVSSSTVSRVLNDEPGISSDTRQLILTEAKKYKFSLKKRKKPMSRSILNFLLVIPEFSETSSNPFFDVSELYESIHNVFSAEKKKIEIATFSEINENIEQHIEGISAVLFAFDIATDNVINSLTKKNIPYVYLMRMIGGQNYVSLNNFRGMENLAGLLAAKGHSRIGYLGQKTKPVNTDRFKGYMSACYDLEMDMNKLPVLHLGSSDEIDRDTANYFLDRKCDAVCCFNDRFAISLIEELRSMNVPVPEKISVTGFDNSVMRRHYSPLITTLNLSVYEMGFFAARWLRDNIINNEKRSLRLEIDGNIIQGETIADRRR